MLPVLFTLVIPPSLGIAAFILVSLASGAWQWRTARLSAEPPKAALKTFFNWTAGTAVVLFAAVKILGGQNILALQQPLAIPVHTYGILVAGGFLGAMTLPAPAADRAGLSRPNVPHLPFGILPPPL